MLLHEIERKQHKLEDRLATESGSNVNIEKIKSGSVVMKLVLPDKISKDYLELLVETGVFDEILQDMFITDEFKFQCNMQCIKLTTVVVQPNQGEYSCSMLLTNEN